MTSQPGVVDLDVALEILDGIDFAVRDPDQPPIAAGADPASINIDAVSDAGSRRLNPLSELSPVDALERVLVAVDDSEPRLHAWATLAPEAAQRQALAAERRLVTGAVRRPLEGITIGVKDIIDVAGMPCSANFAPFADRVPRSHSAVVQRLVDAGALIVGKTVTTQFAFSDPAESANPWDLTRTPGGSSSGSAVAVAAGHCDAALGTQTGGSTIRPAAYCGVVGLKPSRGRISLSGVLPVAWSLDHVGILARDVAICAELLACAAPARAPVNAVPATSPPLRPLRIAVVDDLVDLAAAETAAAVRRVALLLADQGSQVESVQGPDRSLVQAALKVVMWAEMAAVHQQLIKDYRPHYQPLLAQAVTASARITAAQYLNAQRLRARLDRSVDVGLRSVDAWLFPSVADVAPSRATTGDRSMQVLASLFGLPAISIPVALSANGLPIGVQLVAARGRDERLLEIAQRVSSGVDWTGWKSMAAAERARARQT